MTPFSRLSLAAVAAFVSLPAAHAQLALSGRVTGAFTDSPAAHATVYNAPDGSVAWIKSGVPEHAWDLQTSLEFHERFFTDIGPGLVADNLFEITNGRTLLGTTATAAHFDLWVDLTGPETSSHRLTAIPFTIVNTPNGADPASVDDWYSITADTIAPFQVGDYRVRFAFTAPDSFAIPENASRPVGALSVTLTPVPEPSTYAFAAALLLLAAIAWHRWPRRLRAVVRP